MDFQPAPAAIRRGRQPSAAAAGPCPVNLMSLLTFGLLLMLSAALVSVTLLVLAHRQAVLRVSRADEAGRAAEEKRRDLERRLAECRRELGVLRGDLETIGASVSHDLRNPLNTVGLNLHLLRTAIDAPDPALGRTALGHVERAQRDMTRLMDRLQRFARVSAARFDPELVDMTALVHETFAELRHGEPPQAVDFQVDSLPPARADRELVRTLLVSLLDNALRHTRDQAPRRIAVEGRAGSPPVYTVRDNGPGIGPIDAGTLFEPFRRGDDGGEHGVGLAVAVRAAERHGGAVWVESHPGEGAQFCFRLAPPGDA